MTLPFAAEVQFAPPAFKNALSRFLRMVAAQDGGHAFTGFDEGMVGVWENYKVRLRDHALSILEAQRWSEGDIGSGLILKHTIDAIEIQNSRVNLVNNLVAGRIGGAMRIASITFFWRRRPIQNRGPRSNGFCSVYIVATRMRV